MTTSFFTHSPPPTQGLLFPGPALCPCGRHNVGFIRENPPMPGCSSPPNLNHRWSGGTVRHGLQPTLLLHHLSPLLASSHPYLHVQVPPNSLSRCTNNRLSNSHFLRARYVPDIMLIWRSICLSLCPFTRPSRQTDR